MLFVLGLDWTRVAIDLFQVKQVETQLRNATIKPPGAYAREMKFPSFG
jgi:hypothetical protein